MKLNSIFIAALALIGSYSHPVRAAEYGFASSLDTLLSIEGYSRADISGYLSLLNGNIINFDTPSVIRDVKTALIAEKREELLDLAVGFSNIYKSHKDHGGIDEIADVIRFHSLGYDPARAGRKKTAAPDWCAAFARALVQIVDEKIGGASPLESENGSSLASAEKLLSIFDPSTPMKPSLFNGKRIPKQANSFIGPSQPPIAGCLAIYTEANQTSGHVALVLSVDSSGTMRTVEGNTFSSDDSSSNSPNHSKDAGIYSKVRPWGAGKSISYAGQDGKVERKFYRGCVLPWPEMALLMSPAPSSAKPAAVASSAVKHAIFRLPDLKGLENEASGVVNTILRASVF